MAKFVKVILFLLLAVALHGVAGNVFTEKQVEQPEHAVTYSMKPQGQINAPESPYLPVAELTNLQSHQISVTRIQRVQIGEYFSSLRNVLQCCADRDNSLSQHWGRIYNTTTSYYCQPASEYYVFTLRHIIIENSFIGIICFMVIDIFYTDGPFYLYIITNKLNFKYYGNYSNY